MTEKEIQKLGFEEQIDNDNGKLYHYYTYKIADGVEFITPANDEVESQSKWYVEFFNSDPKIRFNDSRDLQTVINILENSKVKK